MRGCEIVVGNLFKRSSPKRGVGVSRFHFARSFKTTFGVSPRQYILRRRIERARDLLLSSDLPTTEIATLSGFGGPMQFATAFRKYVGLSPSQYRRHIA